MSNSITAPSWVVEHGTLVPQPMFPPFEGAEVHASRLKISAGAALELDDIVAKVDDLVKVLVTVKVVGVHHDVHRTTGQLVRVQLAHAQSCELWGVGDG